MISRSQSIEAILKRCQIDIQKIEEEYNKSLHAKSIDPDLKIDIKNFLGNLRSILDYLAHEIKEKCSPNVGVSPFYFPITENSDQFTTNTRRWFPSLNSSFSDLFNYLESIQPYKDPNNQWLANFNKVNNENKHEDLIEQKRTETKRVNVNVQGQTIISYNPAVVTFSQQAVQIIGVPVNPATQMPVPHPSQQVEVVTWVDFQFEDINVSALWLLKKSLEEVTNIYQSLQKLL